MSFKSALYCQSHKAKDTKDKRVWNTATWITYLPTRVLLFLMTFINSDRNLVTLCTDKMHSLKNSVSVMLRLSMSCLTATTGNGGEMRVEGSSWVLTLHVCVWGGMVSISQGGHHGGKSTWV